MPDGVPVDRPSSLRKRAAVLAAGRDLFGTEGYERTSVDAVAARAGISKRTVYDYFGDKDGVLDAVIMDVATGLAATVRAAFDEEPSTGDDLDRTLLALARRVATTTFASSDYRLLRHLMRQGRWTPGPEFAEFDDLLESRLAERFRVLADRGAVDMADVRRGAQHFIALTFLLALDLVGRRAVTDVEVDAVLVDGVAAFVRAYRREADDGSAGPRTPAAGRSRRRDGNHRR